MYAPSLMKTQPMYAPLLKKTFRETAKQMPKIILKICAKIYSKLRKNTDDARRRKILICVLMNE